MSVANVQPAAALDCANAMSTPDLNACSEIEYKTADADLNAAYRKALAEIAKTDLEAPHDPKSFEAAFRKSQRAWVAWRDAECEGLMPMFMGGGSATTGAILGCLTEKTQARAKEISERLTPPW
ncbi:MAG: DUF1311 domain-containing protein [Verrucomicrobiae bacterium]|nr:DUF1311 domain-containing protein [Verrucomicrobiae bacterium]